MEITEVRIKLMEGSEDRLRAFCSITIDDSFVIRDLKIIDGTTGSFVAMPSRKLTGHCSKCHHKNHLRANYCNHCGDKQSSDSGSHYDSPQKLYADVAHPINSECRELIQEHVIEEFQAELKRSNQPGYRSRYDDGFDSEEGVHADDLPSEPVVVAKKQDPKSDRITGRDTENASDLDDSIKVDSAEAVKKPQFMKERPETTTAPEDDEMDSGFGEGIF